MSNIVSINEVANNNNWYSVKEMCDSCQVDRRTWENFKAEFSCENDFTTENCITGAHNTKYYSESILKQFQLWLMRNQANQGKASEVVKQNTTNNLELGALVNVALTSREAWNQLKALGDAKLEAEEKNQQLEVKTKQLEHALEYDQVKDWTPWNKLKKDWKNQFDMLRHKINYTELFKRAGLVENKHYKKKVMGLDNYPTVLVSTEAEDMLFDWLDSHN